MYVVLPTIKRWMDEWNSKMNEWIFYIYTHRWIDGWNWIMNWWVYWYWIDVWHRIDIIIKYSVEHIVEMLENPLPPLHTLLFPISSKGSFICQTEQYIPQPLLHQLHRAMAGTGNISIDPLGRINLMTHRITSWCFTTSNVFSLEGRKCFI